VLWYPVALNTPFVPFAHPFVLRNWDKREGLPQTPLGTDQDFKTLFFGPKPIGAPGTVCGSSDLWSNGLSYDDWIARNYSCICTAGQCGVWNPLCNQIYPNVFNFSLTFSDGQGPFTGTVTYDENAPWPGWKGGLVFYDCNGTPIPISVNLRLFPISGVCWGYLAGQIPNFGLTSCDEPRDQLVPWPSGPGPMVYAGKIALVNCPNLVGPGPWDGACFFTVK
jgi:hypothetical protein